MRVVVLSSPPDLSAYVGEMLRTWGLSLFDVVRPDALASLDPADVPVVICPVLHDIERRAASLVAYARRGGTVICCLPAGELLSAAGLQSEGEKELPLRLRVTGCAAPALAGESVPIVGRAELYRCEEKARVLAWLHHPGRYHGESAGLTETPVGAGRILAFVFDLPLCVLMLRQGDPARAEFVPQGDSCARPSHIAADFGPSDAGWTPFADMLGHFLVGVVRGCLPAPAPMLSHLPGAAPGILLYSGDEDCGQVAWNNEEFDCIAAAGGRMNLYVIPTRTNSTRADIERYRQRHDVGPHPDLRALDGHPLAERVAELDRQIRMFRDMFGFSPLSMRNHCTVWPGYMEPVEVMERLGVRMDGNFFSGSYMRERNCAPYAAFGGAMPMRFCRPDGRLLHVFQQHTHCADDVMFGTAAYSYRLSPAQFEPYIRRVFSDITTRFHTPYALCIHPGNWVNFSRLQGEELLRQARERAMPIWSFDRWCRFWQARDTWRMQNITWDGKGLSFVAEGETSHADLCLSLPVSHAGRTLAEVRLNGALAAWRPATRHGEATALLSIPNGGTRVTADASYATE